MVFPVNPKLHFCLRVTDPGGCCQLSHKMLITVADRHLCTCPEKWKQAIWPKVACACGDVDVCRVCQPDAFENDASEVQAMPTESTRSIEVLGTLKGKVSESIYTQLEARVQMGEKKYGTRLKSFNGRDCLLDAKQEALDGVMYAAQAMLEGKSIGHLLKLFLDIVESIDAPQ